MTTPATLHPQDPPIWSFSRRLGLVLVFSAIGLLVILRAASDLALMRETGSDPQTPIGILFLMAAAAYWLVFGCLVAGLLFLKQTDGRRTVAGILLLLGWAYSIRLDTWKVQSQQQALIEARVPATSPNRLEHLLELAAPREGYLLDNRIAAHPNATPAVLRSLYARHRGGTIMVLARNPNSPEDILRSIVDYDLTRSDHEAENEAIRESLEKNPKLPDAIRRKLEGDKRPATK